ncbi:membrane protein [Allofrancisella guangzhouensis]|uniref:Membrane protein n=1 Tax=Allofrancisella guangzhouensis TaxID=594679 RepID=A0A0A8E5M1_9GAMM|nr:membrane protein [Allofrancisella guangzhouensis]
MNIKQIYSPILIGIISTAICFNFGFLTTVFSYSGLKFFYAYIIFSILICYPINLIAFYISKLHPEINTHSSLTKYIVGSSKFRSISVLFTGILIILLTLILFTISVYLSDFIRSIYTITFTNTLDNNTNLTLISLGIVFIYISILFILSLLRVEIYIKSFFKFLAFVSLVLVIVTVLIIRYTSPHSLIEFKNFNAPYSQTNTLSSMLLMALVYAILSNFISLAFYKNILTNLNTSFNNLRTISFSSMFYNILFSLLICMTIYTTLGNYSIFLQSMDEVPLVTIFSLIKQNSFTVYTLLEVTFILFNLITVISALVYITKITNKFYIKVAISIIPLLITISLILQGAAHVSFSKMFALHLIIIFIFLFDIFIISWIYDAQKLSYEILKNTNIKLSPIFNISLRIIIPFICIYIIVGYIFLCKSVILQILIAVICMIIYISTGIISNKVFNKRKF